MHAPVEARRYCISTKALRDGPRASGVRHSEKPQERAGGRGECWRTQGRMIDVYTDVRAAVRVRPPVASAAMYKQHER